MVKSPAFGLEGLLKNEHFQTDDTDENGQVGILYQNSFFCGGGCKIGHVVQNLVSNNNSLISLDKYLKFQFKKQNKKFDQ